VAGLKFANGTGGPEFFDKKPFCCHTQTMAAQNIHKYSRAKLITQPHPALVPPAFDFYGEEAASRS
jgi:hypothetical protein